MGKNEKKSRKLKTTEAIVTSLKKKRQDETLDHPAQNLLNFLE